MWRVLTARKTQKTGRHIAQHNRTAMPYLYARPKPYANTLSLLLQG